MNIDLDNFKLIIETLNNTQEVLIGLKSELESEIDILQSRFNHDKFKEDLEKLELMKLRLQVVQGLKIN